MNCPVCKPQPLARQPLQDNLSTDSCPACRGHWVRGAEYFQWLQSRIPVAESNIESPDSSTLPPIPEDSAPALLCPECGRILTRNPVGQGIPFRLDRCAHCGGIWFAQNQWPALRARNLHDRIHLIFSADWQEEILQQRESARLAAIQTQLLGAQDFNEIKRIKAWIDGHPKRAELYAFLMDKK